MAQKRTRRLKRKAGLADRYPDPRPVLAIDPSLTATGWAVLWGVSNGRVTAISGYFDTDDPGLTRDEGGRHVWVSAAWWMEGVPATSVLAIEGDACGARFSRELQGEVAGVILAAAMQHRIRHVEYIGIRHWKPWMVPQWHGLSKGHWKNAGRRGKFKASLPDKQSVRMALLDRYGLNIRNDNEADAVAIALATASHWGDDWSA